MRGIRRRIVTFQLVDRAAAGRIGRFSTQHGDVTTPTLLPVINPNIDLVSASEMRDLFGCEMVITNSYVIHKHEHLRTKALQEGVHSVLNWDGPVMTDSGTFQMYVYGDVEVGPADIVAFQRDMGVDVATCLDIFVTPDMTRQQADEAVTTTLERTKIACDVLAESRGPSNTVLNTTVQGGTHFDLRERCAETYRDLPTGYHTIGGVVPLMEQQRYPDLVRSILHSQQTLRKDRPVHLFGAGHPLVFPLATALGCDLYDSSSYAKYAADGRVMTDSGTLHVNQLVEWPFASRFVDKWTPKELVQALATKRRRTPQDTRGGDAGPSDAASDPRREAERALALHNLDVMFTDLRRVRQAIREGTLWELVEQRAACHPHLAAATRVLGDAKWQSWLEAREPISGDKAIRYTGHLTHRRPMFARVRARLVHRFTPTAIPLEQQGNAWCEDGEERPELGLHKEPSGGGPFGAAIGPVDGEQDHAITNAWGVVPLGLDEAYPFAQSVQPRLEGLGMEHMGWVGQTKDAFLEAHGFVPALPGPGLGANKANLDMLQILRTADWQFGRGAGLVLTGAAEPDAVRPALLAESHAERAGAGATPAGSTLLAGLAGAGLEPAGDFRVERSRKTRKIRTVHLGADHILSLRAGDGLWTLKQAGARLLHAALPAPANRVVVHADSVPFNRDGKSVFAQFVLGMDEALRPGDECLVVDEDDHLIAIGQLKLMAEEAADWENGMAVKVREGVPAEDRT